MEVPDPAIQDLLDNLGQDNYLDLPAARQTLSQL